MCHTTIIGLLLGIFKLIPVIERRDCLIQLKGKKQHLPGERPVFNPPGVQKDGVARRALF
jgi:hypothetical protein